MSKAVWKSTVYFPSSRELSPKHKCSHVCTRSCFLVWHPLCKFAQFPLTELYRSRIPSRRCNRGFSTVATRWVTSHTTVMPLGWSLIPSFSILLFCTFAQVFCLLRFVRRGPLHRVPSPRPPYFSQFPSSAITPIGISSFISLCTGTLSERDLFSLVWFSECVLIRWTATRYFCRSRVVIYNSSGNTDSSMFRVAYIQ